MYFTIFIFVCIKLCCIEAGLLPKPYHPLRGTNQGTVRLYPIEMRDNDDPPDNYSWRRYHLGNLRKDDDEFVTLPPPYTGYSYVPIGNTNDNAEDEEFVRLPPPYPLNNLKLVGNLRDGDEDYVPVTPPNIGVYENPIENPTNDNLGDEGYVNVTPPDIGFAPNNGLDNVALGNPTNDDENGGDVDEDYYVPVTPPYHNMGIGVGRLRNDREQDYVKATPNKNDMVLDIVRQMVKNLKTLDQTSVDVTDNNLRSPDSMEDSKEISLFGSKGYVHLTYPGKQKNNMLNEIVRQMARNLRISDASKSVEESALNYNLRQRDLDQDLLKEIESLLNPKNNQKDIGELVKTLFTSLRTQQTNSDENKDNNNLRRFDTIVHFEDNPRRVLDNDVEASGVAFGDLLDPNKDDLVMDAAMRMIKADTQRMENDYKESFNMGRRANGPTPKTVYEFNELVI